MQDHDTSQSVSERGSPWPETAHDHYRAVLIALRRIIRATDLQSKQLARNTGLTTPQIVLLQAIGDTADLTPGQLARRVSLSQGTVTAILDRLEERGLVARRRSDKDRRVLHLRLTPQGEAALHRAPPLLPERFIARFEALAPAEQRGLVACLEQVATMMGGDQLDAGLLLDLGPPDAAD